MDEEKKRGFQDTGMDYEQESGQVEEINAVEIPEDEDLEFIVDLDEDYRSNEKKKNEALAADPDKEEDAGEGGNGAKSFWREIVGDLIFLLVVFALTLLFVKFVAQRTVVVGSSMAPTLMDGDNLVVDKISYHFREPERFDIIVFPFDITEETYYIKRIIGLPGETVRIDDNGNIYINEVLLEESYGAEVILDPGIAYGGITLGDDQYFVMGDNRNHSSDSRTVAVGLIERERLLGRAIFKIYPFSSFGRIGD